MAFKPLKTTKKIRAKILFAILGLFLVPLAASYFWRELFSINPRLASIQKEVHDLRQKKALLEKALSDSEKREFIEKEARQRLGMVYPGETIVVLPDDSDSKVKSKNEKVLGAESWEKEIEIWRRWVEEIF